MIPTHDSRQTRQRSPTTRVKTTVQQHEISNQRMPLAEYREVAAHLRQVAGVETVLLPQTSQVFDYQQSQVGGLQFQYTDAADAATRQRVAQILQYYGDRYGAWIMR